MQTDIRILEVEPIFSEEKFRTPLKFGTGVVREITSLTVCAKVQNRQGKVAEGLGNILLSDLWAFPSELVPHQLRDKAMREVSCRFCRLISELRNFAHPIDFYFQAKEELLRIGKDVSNELHLKEQIPSLACLVCASPVDACLHDAFGEVNGISSYDGYGPEFMSKDLSFYLGSRYKGKYIADYVRKKYVSSLPIWHLVGGMDKLRDREVDGSDPEDGLPVSLEEWIKRDGIFCFKLKLKGTELKWDIERTKKIIEVVKDTLSDKHGRKEFYFSIDTNECCSGPDYVIEYLNYLRTDVPDALRAMLYIEQPTERDLSHHSFDMRKLASIKPVLADEGITDLDKFELAKELGWSGIALKTCKGHSSALLYIARCEEEGLLYSVQDLTNAGISLIHSAGLTARINPVKGVEYNSRQYLPLANEEMMKKHPDVFSVKEGKISTGSIGNTGLGY
jgi:L-alanine-DL-glutamate epimerase-like enolase superfamily enzyme